jgi:hypothetical membrane protein
MKRDRNDTPESRRPVTAAAWFAIAGQFLFVVTWLVSAALQPEYSHLEQYVSELGAGTADAPWLVNGGLVLLGLTFAGLAFGLRSALPRTRAAVVAVALFVVAGLLFVVGGLFALECAPTLAASCDRAFEAGDLSVASHVHIWSSLAMQVALLLGPFALAWATWRGPTGRPALVAGLAGVAITGVTYLPHASDSEGAVGLAQRFGLASVHVWVGLVAIGLLVWAGGRRARIAGSRGANGDLEPFRFLAPSWSGEGEVRYRRWLGWLRLPRRFSWNRRVEYPGEAVWLVHDVLSYENGGPVVNRTMVARPLAPNVMHLTADDMPGGGDAVLTPGGLDLEPYWVLSPYFGLPWPLRCSGEVRLGDGDSLAGRIDMSLMGFLPVGRLSLRASRT